MRIGTSIYAENRGNGIHRRMVNYKASKDLCVYNTTGPWILIDLYDSLSEQEKNEVYLIPAKYVTPFDLVQAQRFRYGEMSEELEDCLEEAFAVHYFLATGDNIFKISSKTQT